MSSPAISGTSAIDRFFRISDRGSTVGSEVRGGDLGRAAEAEWLT